jgi:hypothetical protein
MLTDPTAQITRAGPNARRQPSALLPAGLLEAGSIVPMFSSSPSIVAPMIWVGNSEQGSEGRVPRAVSDLVGVGTADDGTTGSADRDALAQQIGSGTGR